MQPPTTPPAAPAPEVFIPGDVVEDAYGNPAVVTRVDAQGQPVVVMQVCGSDRGRLGRRGAILRRVTGTNAEWAREIARAEWRNGNRWTV